jgi:hypothetical protein
MSRSWQSDVQLNYQTNNAATTALSWIINSFYFEYRSPIRLRNNFINPIRYEYFCSEIRTNPIGFGSDLHTSNTYCLVVLLLVVKITYYRNPKLVQLSWPMHTCMQTVNIELKWTSFVNKSNQYIDWFFRPKKSPVVPVSCREKIRVGRSEIIFCWIFFSWFWRFFAGRFSVEFRHQY